MSATRREVLGRVALLAAGGTVALLLAEAGLRLLDPFQERLRGDQLRLPHNVKYVIDNNNKNHRLEARIEHSKNALGFRGPDLPRDRDGRLVAFAVGGSTTECFYLGDGRDWPAQAAARLRCSFPGLLMNNAGLDGFSSFGQRLLLEQRILRLRPKLVLFLEGVTDVGREDLDRMPGAPTGVELLARHSAVVSTALNAWRTRRATARGLRHFARDLASAEHIPTDPARLARGLRRHQRVFLPGFRERLEALVELCLGQGTLPVLVTQPALFGAGRDDVTGTDLATLSVAAALGWGSVGERWNGAMAWALLESYNDVTRSLSAELEVPLIDLARRLPKSSRFYYDEIHFTDAGAAEIGKIVSSELCQVLGSRLPGEQRADCACAR
jgi:hypothetical protein